MNLYKALLLVSVILLLSFAFPVVSYDLNQNEDIVEKNIEPLDGELLLPDDYKTNTEDKKCITICDQWGEDCIINPSSNSGARKCRRVCKSFAETCF